MRHHCSRTPPGLVGESCALHLQGWPGSLDRAFPVRLSLCLVCPGSRLCPLRGAWLGSPCPRATVGHMFFTLTPLMCPVRPRVSFFSSAGLAFRDGAMPCLRGHSQSLAHNSNLKSVIKEETKGTRSQTELDIFSSKER